MLLQTPGAGCKLHVAGEPADCNQRMVIAGGLGTRCPEMRFVVAPNAGNYTRTAMLRGRER